MERKEAAHNVGEALVKRLHLVTYINGEIGNKIMRLTEQRRHGR